MDVHNNDMASNVTSSNSLDLGAKSNNTNNENNTNLNIKPEEKEKKSNFLLEFIFSFFNIFYLAYRGISFPLQSIFNASSKTVDDAYQQAKFMNNNKSKRDDDLGVIAKKIKDFLGITQILNRLSNGL